jgi:hypothetical protein
MVSGITFLNGQMLLPNGNGNNPTTGGSFGMTPANLTSTPGGSAIPAFIVLGWDTNPNISNGPAITTPPMGPVSQAPNALPMNGMPDNSTSVQQQLYSTLGVLTDLLQQLIAPLLGSNAPSMNTNMLNANNINMNPNLSNSGGLSTDPFNQFWLNSLNTSMGPLGPLGLGTDGSGLQMPDSSGMSSTGTPTWSSLAMQQLLANGSAVVPLEDEPSHSSPPPDDSDGGDDSDM